MAERSLKQAGYHIDEEGTVLDEKRQCIGYLKDGMLTTQPVYESTVRFGFNETDERCRSLIESVANNLGLQIGEQPGYRNLFFSKFLLSIKTNDPVKMPAAVTAYRQLKTALKEMERESWELSTSARFWFSNRLKGFSENCRKSILESVKAEQKRK